MSTIAARPSATEQARQLGNIPVHRIRLDPPPGTATEADCVRLAAAGRLCELVDGTLVEKAVGTPESMFAALLIEFLGPFVRRGRLGVLTAPDGMYRMLPGNIREPDVGFTAWGRVQLPIPQVCGWCPDLCVEVLSPDNTRAEMATKRAEYFAAGCRLVWEFDPRGRSVDVYTAADSPTRLTADGVLDGGAVLPGFTLSLAELFAEYDLGRTPPAP